MSWALCPGCRFWKYGAAGLCGNCRKAQSLTQDIDAEWWDICAAIYSSGLVAWDDWIDLGVRERQES